MKTILITKERRVKETFEKLKLYKTKKKKLELLEECKETLILTISNPTMTLENQESEVYANLKAEKENTDLELNLATKVVEKMTRGSREDDLGTKPKNIVTKIFVTVTKPGIPKTTKNEIIKPNNFRSSKIPTSWKTTPSKKMTPTKKMTGKMTAKIKNSPVATNVASRLGLKSLPSVKRMTDRLQGTHLPPAQIKAKYNLSKITKPSFIKSSFGVQKPGCTPVNRAGQPMGVKQGQRTGVHNADGP